MPTDPAKDALARWHALGKCLLDPSFELTLEEFAELFAVYRCLQSHGVVFDGTFNCLMTCLARQGIPNDGESDDDSEPLEDDDPNCEDGGEGNEFTGYDWNLTKAPGRQHQHDARLWLAREGEKPATGP